MPLQSVTGLAEAGCDEAGRGCLAGPVCAAAVILPPDIVLPGLDDSKKLTERQRDRLREVIQSEAVAWAVAFVSPADIDRINILQASVLAMHRALARLDVSPEAIAVDGNYFRNFRDIPWHTYVKGDGRFANIAAASVLAKTHRDEYMSKAHLKWPQYHWDANKGYPTRAHRDAIARFGPSPIHRLSFRLTEPPSLFDDQL